jgi:signal transduction histidine kinase/CheY-like chemotaxis protein
VFRVCHPDGAVKHIKANGMVILGEDGAAERMIGINVDITDQKQAEEVHLQLEKQLQHAQKLESLGVLAGGIAHDFNNILTIIMGNCTLVQMNPAKTENYITEIEQAAERAAGLCRQMLAYAGKTQFVKARVEIAKLVAETVKMLNATLPQNTAIKFDCFPDVPFIKADASQISQVVLNLIINASEAIGKVQGEILVSLSRVFITSEFNEKDHLGKVIHPGPYACLEVTDNGCGMSDEVCSRMFEPFYTTKFTGRGLGLSAVLGIITTHGGSLQLFSQPGKGTTFKVYWPAQIDNSTPDEPFRQQAQSEPWHGSGTILLVEDEDQIKMLAKTLLNKLGFAVIEASNGKEALESYKQFSDEIVLVITDIGMPVMDGYEMLNELKKMNADLPIIVSSGFAEKDIASRVARQEIAGMINKPYNIEQLRAVLKGVMKDRYQNVTSVK